MAAAEGIDARARKGGTLGVARTPAQLRRARAQVATARSWDRGEDDLRLLDASEARARLAATRVLGGTYTPDCAAVHPARLVRGLARAVERLGGRVFERTPVREIRPRRALTALPTRARWPWFRGLGQRLATSRRPRADAG